MIQNPAPSSSSSKATSHAHAPSTYDTLDQSTPVQAQKKPNRRQSDRIRSPSDSSGTSSSSEDEAVHQQRLTRQSTAPPAGTAFPSSSSETQAVAKPIHPKRKKTLSDSSRLDSPLAMRVTRNGGAPPSSFAGGFARPSPASRRRRGSQSDNDDRSPEYGGRFGRSASTQNMSAASPTWSSFGGRQSGPASPISPGVDHTSFHARAKSPEEMRAEEEMQAEMEMRMDGGPDEVGHEGGDEVDEAEDIIGQGMMGAGEAMNPRLSRISVSSPNRLGCGAHARPSRPHRYGPRMTSCKRCRSRIPSCRESLRSLRNSLHCLGESLPPSGSDARAETPAPIMTGWSLTSKDSSKTLDMNLRRNEKTTRSCGAMS